MPRSYAPRLIKQLFFRTQHWRRVLGEVTVAQTKYVVSLYVSQPGQYKRRLFREPVYWVSDTTEHPFAFAIAVPLDQLAARFDWHIPATPNDFVIFRFNSRIFYFKPSNVPYIFVTHPPARFALPPPLGDPFRLRTRRVSRPNELGLPRLPADFLEHLLDVLSPPDRADLLSLCQNELTRVHYPRISLTR